jgi:competence protein ComEC
MINNEKNIKFKNKRRKKIFWCLFAFLSVIVLLLFVFLKINEGEKILQVSFLDVGQGDSSLIRTPEGKIILIDGGPDNLTLRRLGEILPFYKRKIDLIIISHFHDDHITGLIEILRRYRVSKIIYGPEIVDSSLFDILSAVALENKTELAAIFSQAKVSLGHDCTVLSINPLSLKVKQDDNNSLITKLDCNFKIFLFSGDNGVAVEKVLLLKNIDIKADIFKASHHGSKTSNTGEFLRAVNPDSIIISVGLDNRFKHPATETLKTMNQLGIKILRTDILGTIDIFSNIQ